MANTWHSVRLEEVCVRITDGTHQSPRFEAHGIPFLVISDVVSGQIDWSGVSKWVDEETYEANTSRCRPERGDVLYTAVGSFGVAVPVDSDNRFMFQRHIAHIKPDVRQIHTRFLAHILNSPAIRALAERVAKGVAQRTVTLGDLKKFEIPLPPLTEQRRIADILDKADAIRRKRKEAIALTEDLLRSAFLEMFGDPVTNPMGWPRSTFGSQLELLEYGPRFYNEKYSDDGIRIVRITDLNASGRLDFSAMPRLVVDERDRLRYALRPGDVIFARSGATVGKTALSMPGDPESIPGAYFIRLRFKPEVRPLFARQVLASERIQKIIVSRSRQSAQQNFSGPGIRELPLPVPPRVLQERLEQLATARQAIFEHYRRADTESQVLFNSLLDQAFTGRSRRAGVVG